MKRFLLLLAIAATALAFGACSSDTTVTSSSTGGGSGGSLPQFLNATGALHTMNGSWQGCRVDGTGSEDLTVAFVVNEVFGGNAEHDAILYSSSDCSGNSNGSSFEGVITYTVSGAKNVSWDASGIPGGLNDPITVSQVTITDFFGGTENIVAVIDDSGATLVWYLKSEADAGPIGADGFPNEISQDGTLTQ